MTIHDWNPDDGDALQGDVCLFRIPDYIVVDTSDEITAQNGRLILAEGEATGHHHAIWDRNPPAMFREDGAGSGIYAENVATMLANATKTGTARLYRDPRAISALVVNGFLTTAELAIGILIVDEALVVLRHDEHDAICIPPGRYYVGGQQEWDAAEARRVAD